MGDINLDDFLCRMLVKLNQVVIVDVEYRLAPEHKWPAQLEDCFKVYKWVSWFAVELVDNMLISSFRP